MMAVTTLTQTLSARANRLVPSLAVSTLVSTILLILVGSIVRVTGNGLGCPDWPLCYGQAIPPALAGAWVEFSHRLIGGVTGIEVAALGLLIWKWQREDVWLLRSAGATAALFLIQIVLGGLHVTLELPASTGWVHTANAMLIVGLLAVQVARTAPAAQNLRAAAAALGENRRFAAWLSVTTALTYALLLTGSLVTRRGAALVCPSFPSCGSDAAALRGLIQLQMLHRYTAFVVAALVLGLVGWLLTRQSDLRLRHYAYGLALLLLLQFGLGISNVLLRLPMWSRALHLALGASLWASLVVLWVTFRRGAAAPNWMS